MSRIHEALKRAEQLRSVPLEVPPPMPPPPPIVPEVGSHVAELPGLPPTRPPVVDPLVHTHIDTKTRAAEFLRFDDIWTQCASPGWRLNLERNVFVDPAAPQAVREQFRTLRSRLYQIRDKTAVTKCSGYQLFAGRRQDFCGQQSCSCFGPPAKLPGSFDRCRSA